MKLSLGVIEQPYADPLASAPTKVAKARKGKANKPRKTRKTKSQNTGDVAEILEAKYGVMEHFFDLHGQEIADEIAESMGGALETMLMGGPTSSLYAAADAAIGEQFREFLDQTEMDGQVNGVPTLASLKGVSHRFKHPYAKGHPVRPSFVDTGLYRESFVATVKED